MLLFFVVFSYFFTTLYGQEDELNSRIQYGQKAVITDFPYFAALENCNAAIISESWLVTAAHCVAASDTTFGQVWLGRYFTGTSDQPIFYDAVVIHPHFDIDDRFSTNDIALLRLAAPLQFSTEVRAVALPNDNDLYQNIEQYPHFVPGRDVNQGDLMKIEVSGLTQKECLSYFSLWERIYLYRYRHKFEEILCTKRESYNGHTMPGLGQPNTGSPLVDGNTLLGLAVTATGDLRMSSIVTFAKIAKHTEWIRFITRISLDSSDTSSET